MVPSPSHAARGTLYSMAYSTSRVTSPTGTGFPFERRSGIACERCEAVGADLRHSVFTYAMSFLLVTLRRGSAGIYCRSCRRSEALKWGALSAILGWWGVPWGPIYTVQALGIAASGGQQDPEVNRALLVAVGVDLARDGNTLEALEALETSLRFAHDPAVAAAAAELRAIAADSTL